MFQFQKFFHPSSQQFDEPRAKNWCHGSLKFSSFCAVPPWDLWKITLNIWISDSTFKLKSLFYKQYFFSEWTSNQLNISLTFLSSKFDAPVIKTLERIKFSSNQNIGEDASNFDEKNLEETFNWSEVHSEKKYYVQRVLA